MAGNTTVVFFSSRPLLEGEIEVNFIEKINKLMMSSTKKARKSKFIPKNERDVSTNVKKTTKRTPRNEFEEDDLCMLIGQYQASAKKKTTETSSSSNPEYRNKILGLVRSQLEARNQCNEIFLSGLSEITNEIEEDYNAMKDNEKKLELLTGNFTKCIQQATTAYKHKLKYLKEVQLSFKKQYEKMESDHKNEAENLVDEFEYDIMKLQDKLVKDTKRSGFETLRRSIFHAMRNDF